MVIYQLERSTRRNPYNKQQTKWWKLVEHFQNLLSTTNINALPYHPSNQRYMPILDDPIHADKVCRCIQKLKRNKADGISPGILNLLPATWIILLTQLLNLVFNSQYPTNWTEIKVFTILGYKGCTWRPKQL